jgi:hypothetical protein
MRSSKVLYGLRPKVMPAGFKQGLKMQLEGAKKRLAIVMSQGYNERDEGLVIAINRAIEWNEEKLRELK